MSNFTEAMASNPPRLVVLFKRAENGSEQFQWGIVGSIPMISLIGAVVRVQVDLVSREWMPECDNDPSALVIAWDAEYRSASYYVSKDIPLDPLLGMLDCVRTALVGSRLGQQTAAQRIEPKHLYGPDGAPWRG